MLDIFFSVSGLVLLFPLFVVIALWIKLDTNGSVFYLQSRVGLHNKDFNIIKFRTMYSGSDRDGLITVGDRDPRITRAGIILRRFKLDELPQLVNVLCGKMSFVGPRPEVRHYVDYYTPEQMRIFDVRPGITDPASLLFRNENQLLSTVSDKEQYYIKVIMPEKLRISLEYIDRQTISGDFRIIVRTIAECLHL